VRCAGAVGGAGAVEGASDRREWLYNGRGRGTVYGLGRQFEQYGRGRGVPDKLFAVVGAGGPPRDQCERRPALADGAGVVGARATVGDDGGFVEGDRPGAAAGQSKEKTPVHTVVLDPGHGGTDRGTRGRTGIEKELTLDMAKRVAAVVGGGGPARGVDAHEGHDAGVAGPGGHGGDRKADLFVSIHFNSGGAADGIETYCLPPAGRSRRRIHSGDFLAVGMNGSRRISSTRKCLAGALRAEGVGAGDERGGSRGAAGAVLCAEKRGLSVDFGGRRVLTNKAEEQKILTTEYRERLSKSIVAGILEYRKGTE